jgi:FAD/FMN-containing dehydrogenase
VTPTAIELLAGPEWARDPALGPITSPIRARLVVGLEGTEPEVKWMTAQLSAEWRHAGVSQSRVIDGSTADQLWARLVEFPAAAAPDLVVKASMVPSAVARFVQTVLDLDANCSLQAHAGNGVVFVCFPEFSATDALRVLICGLQPAAVKAGGHACVYACSPGTELTHQAVWGPMAAEAAVMRTVKSQFDPKGIINPGLSPFEC